MIKKLKLEITEMKNELGNGDDAAEERIGELQKEKIEAEEIKAGLERVVQKEQERRRELLHQGQGLGGKRRRKGQRWQKRRQKN